MAILSVALLSPAYPLAVALETPPETALPEEEAPKISDDQLDSLGSSDCALSGPALEPELVVFTYPLELVQLQQWLGKNRPWSSPRPVQKSEPPFETADRVTTKFLCQRHR